MMDLDQDLAHWDQVHFDVKELGQYHPRFQAQFGKERLLRYILLLSMT